MKTSDFDYYLPTELIAQHPLDPRHNSRLMVLERATGRIAHRHFYQLGDYLRPGDILVANNTRVIPARLFGRKAGSGGKVELLLLNKVAESHWRVLAGGKRLTEGTTIVLPDGLIATITAVFDGPLRQVAFSQPIDPLLEQIGHIPLPPYIQAPLADRERYQTIYAQTDWLHPAGSSAAPTAGLHFTADLLFALREQGVLFETCTLHIGLDTFKPIQTEEVGDHLIHSEWATLSPAGAERINQAKLAGGRLIAVGTTTARTLETAAWRAAGVTGSLQRVSQIADPPACPWKPVAAIEDFTDLFIYPDYRFRVVDGLITNFHLPQSSLLMMVAAFSGRETIRAAYQTAIQESYRFYSFGDAMLIL